jgi:ferredoxin--NADP+ reductase
MYRIVQKKILNPQVKLMVVEAPVVAKKAQPGQFIILRVSDEGERIPLTIAGYDREAGTITIVFQEVGKTTRALGLLEEGESILDFVGPLGVPSHFDGIRKACVIGGGLGTAIAWPQAKRLRELGAEVHMVCGFRSKDLVILEEEVRAASDRTIITTDDGSNGVKGFVTDQLKALLAEGNRYDVVIAIGPLIMMKFVSEMTRPLGIRTIVSLNPVMIDGTGMCGGCRVTVGGNTRFACVDGPDFDGHQVDFDEAMRRSTMYRDEEKKSDELHRCRIGGIGHA